MVVRMSDNQNMMHMKLSWPANSAHLRQSTNTYALTVLAADTDSPLKSGMLDTQSLLRRSQY